MPGVRRAGQLVVAEIAVAAVVAAAFGPAWVLIGVGALGSRGAGGHVRARGRAVVVRGRGQPAPVPPAPQARRRARARGRGRRTSAGPPHLPWLRTLAPTLTLRAVQVGTATVGVGADQDGWFAAVEVGSFWEDNLVLAPAISRPAWAPGRALPAP